MCAKLKQSIGKNFWILILLKRMYLIQNLSSSSFIGGMLRQFEFSKEIHQPAVPVFHLAIGSWQLLSNRHIHTIGF